MFQCQNNRAFFDGVRILTTNIPSVHTAELWRTDDVVRSSVLSRRARIKRLNIICTLPQSDAPEMLSIPSTTER